MPATARAKFALKVGASISWLFTPNSENGSLEIMALHTTLGLLARGPGPVQARKVRQLDANEIRSERIAK